MYTETKVTCNVKNSYCPPLICPRLIVLFNSISMKNFTQCGLIKEDSSSHIPFTEVEINLKKDGGSALKKSTIVTPAEQNSGERVDVQVSNEQVDDVSDKDDDDVEIGEDFMTTNVEERAPYEKQMFNEPVCGVIDIHRELNRQGDLEPTHIPSAAQSCQKELKNVEAEVGESGHSLGSLESRVELGLIGL